MLEDRWKRWEGRISKANDIANYIEIKPSTLRKYALLFESSGYVFERDAQNNRVYNQQDIKLLKDFIKIKKGNPKSTNEEILEKLGYHHTNSKLIGNYEDKENQQQILIEIINELKLVGREMKILDKKVDDIHNLLFSITEILSENITTSKEEKGPELSSDKLKKKSIWGLIKSRD